MQAMDRDGREENGDQDLRPQANGSRHEKQQGAEDFDSRENGEHVPDQGFVGLLAQAKKRLDRLDEYDQPKGKPENRDRAMDAVVHGFSFLEWALAVRWGASTR